MRQRKKILRVGFYDDDVLIKTSITITYHSVSLDIFENIPNNEVCAL